MLVGVVMGGLAVRKLTHGDRLATLTGVMVGALGGREADHYSKRK